LAAIAALIIATTRADDLTQNIDSFWRLLTGSTTASGVQLRTDELGVGAGCDLTA
jgi:hypothetical protein